MSGRRAVILVGNPAHPYSRAIRIGRTLSALDYDVEIAATLQDGLPTEERDGELVIRRYPPTGRFALDAATGRKRAADPAARRAPMPVRVWRTQRVHLRDWAWWPIAVRGWWQTLSDSLEPAQIYHVCGTLPLAPALAARARDRRAGRRSIVLHDVIDITMESNNVLHIPPLIRRLLGRRERAWALGADAHTAINDAFADTAAARWALARRPTVVPNYPEPWTAPFKQ